MPSGSPRFKMCLSCPFCILKMCTDFPHLEMKRLCFRAWASGSWEKSNQKLCHRESGAPTAGPALGPTWHHALSLTAGPTPAGPPRPLCSLSSLSGPRKALSLLPWKCEQKPNIGVGPVGGLALLN